MNYLIKACELIKKSKTYYTPKSVLDKINNKYLIGNPPYKTK
jgi:hypothetical protein